MDNNDVFLKACLLSEEDWINSIPDLEKEHHFSKHFEKNMNRLLDKMRNDKYHMLTRKATKILIIAAVIAALTTTVFAAPSSREFIIKHFSTYSSYSVKDKYAGKIDDGLTLGYLPDGFELVYEYESAEVINFEYNYNNEHFYVSKSTILNYLDFDTEKYKYEEIESNKIKYIYYEPTDNTNHFVWSSGNCTYLVGGNLSKEELFEIAKCTK